MGEHNEYNQSNKSAVRLCMAPAFDRNETNCNITDLCCICYICILHHYLFSSITRLSTTNHRRVRRVINAETGLVFLAHPVESSMQPTVKIW